MVGHNKNRFQKRSNDHTTKETTCSPTAIHFQQASSKIFLKFRSENFDGGSCGFRKGPDTENLFALGIYIWLFVPMPSLSKFVKLKFKMFPKLA